MNLCDRVVFNFNLREYLIAGRVERAILALPLQPFGILEGNMVEIEVFSKEHNPVYNMDIVDPNFTGQLAVNFYRNHSTQKIATVSCWTPVGNIAHYTPEKFGLLQLKK